MASPRAQLRGSFSSLSGTGSADGSVPSTEASPSASPAHRPRTDRPAKCMIPKYRYSPQPQPQPQPQLQPQPQPPSAHHHHQQQLLQQEKHVQNSQSPVTLPPRTPWAKSRDSKHRASHGRSSSSSAKEVRSCSVGSQPSVQESQQVLVVMRRPTKSHGANGHARSSSLSNGRDRLSLYAPSPSLCEEAAGGGGGEPRSRADELHDLMSHSLTLGLGGSTSASSSSASASGNNSNDRLIRNRKPLAQKSAEKKARKVRFYRNGDRFFKGVTLAVSAERYRTFDALLAELNRLVGDRANLHQGVRILFALDGSKIAAVDQLQDGESYVCASGEPFKKLEYAKCGVEHGSHRQLRSRITSGKVTICREAPMISGLDHWKERRLNNQANNNNNNGHHQHQHQHHHHHHHHQHHHHNHSNSSSNGSSHNSVLVASSTSNGDCSPRPGAPSSSSMSTSTSASQWAEPMKPRLITVIRNGSRPRKAVRILLNKKTAHSFEQVMADITEQVRPDSGAVRKLFTLDGRQVASLADFFGQDFVFIAYGNEKFSHDDFDLTSNEVKYLPPHATSRSPANPRRAKAAAPAVPGVATGRASLPAQPRPRHADGDAAGAGGGGGTAPSSRDSSLTRSYQHRPHHHQQHHHHQRRHHRHRHHQQPLIDDDDLLDDDDGDEEVEDVDDVLDDDEDDDDEAFYRATGASASAAPDVAEAEAAAAAAAAGGQLVVEVPAVVETRFDVGRIIGDGNFAVVREGVDRRTAARYALKLIDKKRCQGKEVVLESEVQVLGRLRHPNIVKLYDVIDAGSILCLVLELVEGGDLFDAIAAAGKFSEPEARRMTLDLASALDYLHSLNIVHRDVKPENLFVVNLADGMHSLKLGDFGLAQEVCEMLYTVCGTPTYVAPEILLETGYGLKVDVWAMGVILFILLCGYPPFVSAINDQEELFDAILAGTFDFAPPYWDGASEASKDLITLMLHVDAELRFSAAEVLQHPWLTTRF